MNADEEEELAPPTGTVKVEEWISMAVGFVRLVWEPPDNSLRCRPSLFEEKSPQDVVSLHLKLSAGEVVSEMNSLCETLTEVRRIIIVSFFAFVLTKASYKLTANNPVMLLSNEW